MESFLDFIFGNMFLIFLIVSGLIGFFSSNKQEEQKRERPARNRPKDGRSVPPARRAYEMETRQPSRSNTSSRERQEGSISTATADTLEEQQQSQMERAQRKFGGASQSISEGKDVADTVTKDGLDLDFIQSQQLRSIEDIKKELSKEQQVLKQDLRSSLRSKGLINGIIMAEVLGRPRALEPYQSVTQQRYKK